MSVNFLTLSMFFVVFDQKVILLMSVKSTLNYDFIGGPKY